MTDLEVRLRSLGHLIEWPSTPDLTDRVLRQIADPSVAPRRFPWRTLVLAGLALVVFTLSLSPGAREAIARLLGVKGVRIETGVKTTLPPILNLDLGTQIDAVDLPALVEFSVLTGEPSAFGAADAIYYNSRHLGGQVTMVWAPQPDLPESADSGVGMLISSFQGGLDPSTYSKQLSPARNRLLEVEVRGVAGFWIEGDPHVFLYENPEGVIELETIRLAGNVLLWEENGVTIRIESALALDDVLRIAEALVPLTYPGKGA